MGEIKLKKKLQRVVKCLILFEYFQHMPGFQAKEEKDKRE